MNPDHPRIRWRPMDGPWPDDGHDQYQHCRFKASYRTTIEDLKYELSRLGVDEAIIELDVTSRDIRIDGMPRADARPESPRVRLSFEHPALGSLQYPCDTFEDYRDNIRAIAKTLEAQRAMDRYGATRHHQQYRGWQALPETPAHDMTVDQAVEWLIYWWDREKLQDPRLIHDVRLDPDRYREIYRQVARKLHPDAGGDEAQFLQLQRVAAKIEAHQKEHVRG